jgi:ferric iron reductase protein FhuF
MQDVILWSLWYAALIALPLVMTRMSIKHAMSRAVGRRRVLSSINRR